MTETAVAPEKQAVSVLPFAIEADHPRNSNLKLLSLPIKPLRSAFDGARPYIDPQGRHHVPVEQLMTFSIFPRTPGMQLHVNPKTCEYKVVDPLYKNDAACEAIAMALRARNSIGADGRIVGQEPQEGRVDVHQMKTLVRELYRIVKSGEAKVCRGELPSIEDIDKLPGRYLLEPGLQMTTTRPRYEDELDAWVDRLSHSGG